VHEVRAAGGPSRRRCADASSGQEPGPHPGCDDRGDVQRLLCAGLNLPARYRVAARLALGLTGPRRRILGMVLAGEVESAGADVTAFSQGDQVFGLDRHVFGTYAEYVCWPQDTVLAAMPVGLTYEEAAAIPYGGLLALHFLRRAGVRSGPGYYA
jgi:NADPH:quinone reductase-like Zn-dependent oxidoreductase